MPPKSIFRQSGARHFQVVHRSQRDPLIHDPDVSQHVLKEIARQSDKKGKSRADLEATLDHAEIARDAEARVGEAATYGIYYNDTEYDYMQHLRPVGAQEAGVESVLIEALSTKRLHKKAEGSKTKPSILLRDLPQEVLPSTSELPRTYESQQEIPQSISGFQPDMDPHLRQALEALEDDAFVDDDLADDFFGDLIEGGARDSDEGVEFEFYEYGPPEDRQNVKSEKESDTWEERFAQFKAARNASPNSSTSDDEHDFASEGGDTVSGLPAIFVIGGKGKTRRKGGSDASGYSMSSSSMYRNEALQTLDERFDQVMLKQYNDEDEDEDDQALSLSDEDKDEAPQLITSREDFGSMMDEFLNDYEILGRKMKPKLDGDTGAEKLDTLRRAMGQDERIRGSLADAEDRDNDDDNEFLRVDEEKKDRWDCETILTTYSNLENHPRLIRVRHSKPVPKICLDPKTGLPTVIDAASKPAPKHASKNKKDLDSFANDSDDSPYYEDTSQKVTRPRNEDPESKKARKAAVKARQAERRADKKTTKQIFGKELRSAKVRALQEHPTGIRKL
ncbi:Low temperature viability protein-domain-containing protein [Lentinula aff. lateritia]|uniref:Low temperature viability protein-domain-containing protein n=1 Tax=Lentinula aff. lateritia TaxID=2804960 RepID=A0ACC1UEM1_9AGAR|nr:Low temperature viability protein-domain-containing protein [Lentinula aff. lateritia]